MKKLVMVTMTALTIMVFATSAFAANPVSECATKKGGQHIAECAQTMERGVSMMANGKHVCEK